jgi:hypothetical protein
MKNLALIIMVNTLLIGCGVSDNESSLNHHGDSAPITLETVQAVHYSYPLQNNTSRNLRKFSSGVQKYVPGAKTAISWVGDKANLNLEHEDVMIIKTYSNGQKLYESAGWGKKFPREGEVNFFKKLQRQGGFLSYEKKTLSAETYNNSKLPLARAQSKYQAKNYRLRGDWLSYGGWNCQTMAEDVWSLFKNKRNAV